MQNTHKKHLKNHALVCKVRDISEINHSLWKLATEDMPVAANVMKEKSCSCIQSERYTGDKPWETHRRQTILSGGLRLKTRLLQRMWWKEEHQPRALSHSAVPRGVSASSLWSRISSFWARTAMFSISFSICGTQKSLHTSVIYLKNRSVLHKHFNILYLCVCGICVSHHVYQWQLSRMQTR